MKILYFGGQKSGKSNLAKERATLLERNKKPIFIATYDNSFGDLSMQKRVQNHKKERGNSFITVEETLYLDRVIKDDDRVYLIDCISMWVLNSIDWKVEKLLHQLESLKNRKADIIFVLNETGSGIIPIDSLSRKYIDRSGIVGQILAKMCDEVYDVKFGIGIKIK